MNNRVVTSLIFCSLIMSCLGPGKIPKSEVKELEKLVIDQFGGPEVHSGFFISDARNQEKIFEYQADHLYTPASNTKILTFYASMEFLGEYLNGYKIFQRNDTSYFTGTGDPGFLNESFERQAVFEDLQRMNKPVFVDLWKSQRRWGPGWSWDDYSYYYAAERSIFPVYGNMAKISGANTEFAIHPDNFLINIIKGKRNPAIERAESSNIFNIGDGWGAGSQRDTVNVPFRWSGELFTELLSDTLKKSVELLSGDKFQSGLEKGVSWRIVPGSERDTILRKMMYESDNFIAEQLLLNISSAWTDELSSDLVIDSMFSSVFKQWKGQARWVDGSGLSRYNAFSPRFISAALSGLYKMFPENVLFSFFPAGGVRGTIKNWYKSGRTPYVFAKTGTLTGVHCLSGYIKTDSGRTLVFSFMHNGYLGSSSHYKRKMEIVLKWIKQNL